MLSPYVIAILDLAEAGFAPNKIAELVELSVEAVIWAIEFYHNEEK